VPFILIQALTPTLVNATLTSALDTQAAAALADQERAQRAEAQGLTEQLRAEAERRARVFNNAVKAAVSRIQRDLEAERDAVQARCG
jgi:hypothetical protein